MGALAQMCVLCTQNGKLSDERHHNTFEMLAKGAHNESNTRSKELLACQFLRSRPTIAFISFRRWTMKLIFFFFFALSVGPEANRQIFFSSFHLLLPFRLFHFIFFFSFGGWCPFIKIRCQLYNFGNTFYALQTNKVFGSVAIANSG